MSFRNRLTFLFLVIAVVPMIAATVVIFRLLSVSETSKADAGVAAGQSAAINLYRREVRRASAAAGRAGADRQLTGALVRGDRAGASSRARELLGSLNVRRIAVARGGRLPVNAGTARAIAPATRRLVGASGREVGRLQVAVTTAPRYAALVSEVTGLETVVRRNRATASASLRGVPKGRLPDVGDVDVGGRSYRVASFATQGFGDEVVRISVLAPKRRATADLSAGRLLAAAALIGFLILAVTFAIAVSRSLQAQIGRFLAGARRVAAGDFSTQVAVEGGDEFAALGNEFNKMSRQLESRLEELHQERARLEDSIRRIGETFASNLDRDALLEIVVRTTVDAVNADCGRAVVRARPGGPLSQQASAGELAGFGEAIHEVEQAALESRTSEAATRDGRSSLAFPLRSEGGDVMALFTVSRSGRMFTERERDLFNYLARQAAVSLENVDLHEVVQRQALTDELTGLFNHRRFQEVISSEVGRARRFEHSVGLVMVDLDDFKRVNDAYGHQQGDLVLREVGRILRESSRDIDEPARYGGEELAVALPETDLEGTYQLAERVRKAIAALEIPLLGRDGVLHVTASFGAAALPQSAADRAGLVAAADAALYRAKRGGKNRTERAEAMPASPAPAK